MWGQANPTNLKDIADRIIPTRVGTSAPSHNSPTALKGSSPRVWGQVDADFTVDLSARIIPTRVGTSFDTVADLKTATDHPHACGDKIIIELKVSTIIGSSPRVWGQGNAQTDSLIPTRIIPTRVGTSLLRKI